MAAARKRKSETRPSRKEAEEPDLLALGYRRLELALVEAATASLTGSGLPEGAPLVSPETAVKLLLLRSGAAAREPGTSPPPPDPVQLRGVLAARIAAVRQAATTTPGPATAE